MSLYRAADLALCGERPEQLGDLFVQRLLGFGTTLGVKAGLRDKLFTNALRQVVHQPEQAVSRHQLGLASDGAAVFNRHCGDAGLMQMQFHVGAALSHRSANEGASVHHLCCGSREGLQNAQQQRQLAGFHSAGDGER